MRDRITAIITCLALCLCGCIGVSEEANVIPETEKETEVETVEAEEEPIEKSEPEEEGEPETNAVSSGAVVIVYEELCKEIGLGDKIEVWAAQTFEDSRPSKEDFVALAQELLGN